jgi:hypothetical protein
MTEENAPAAGGGEQKTLESIGVPQELADNAKIMWIVTALLSFWGPILFGYVIKKEGQGENAWYQSQVKLAWIAVIIGFFTCGLGNLVFGIMGFLAINNGKDPQLPLIAAKGFEG